MIDLQNDSPARIERLDGRIEVSVPLLLHEPRRSRIARMRQDRNHVNALDALDAAAEVCLVVDFVLEQDAGRFVADDLSGDSPPVGDKFTLTEDPP